MGWLIVLAAVLILGFLPVGIRARYDAEGAGAWIQAACFRFRIYPGKAKPEKKEKKEPAAKKETAPAGKEKKPEPGGGSLEDFLPLVQLGLKLLDELRLRITVTRLDLKLILAGQDPCDLAVNYGRTWAALGNMIPRLERWFRIRKRNMEVECDFLAEQTLVSGEICMVLSFGRLLVMTLSYGIRGLRELVTIKNKRKGGASL